MNTISLETVYEHLAGTIDAVGGDKEALFLAKLALLMADALGDPARALELIDAAARDLD